jgi:hypothetical protein
MFAVVVQESGDAERVRGSRDHVEANVVPQVRNAPGIVSATFTTDEGGRTLNLFLFQTEDAAQNGCGADTRRAATTVHAPGDHRTERSPGSLLTRLPPRPACRSSSARQFEWRPAFATRFFLELAALLASAA